MTVDLVSGYDEEVSSRGLRYEYVGQGQLGPSTVFPSAGPVEGGTGVTVAGPWRGRSSRVSCIFKGIRTPSTVVSSSSVKCLSPANDEVGQVELRIEDLGSTVAVGKHTFEYHPAVSPTSLRPSSGPLMGGSIVMVEALGLQRMDGQAHCMFAGMGRDKEQERRWITAGRTDSGGRVSCAAP